MTTSQPTLAATQTWQALGDLGVVPVVTLDDKAQALPLAEALSAAGLPCAEITLRTATALNALSAAASLDGFCAGAGTVLTGRQARQAVEAGARFLVSPGLSAEVVEKGRAAGVPVLPGVATATEVMTALRLGAKTVKFFPATPLGGPEALRALSAAFPTIRFMPTGGIGPDNLASYLSIPAVAYVGGSWITTPELVTNGDFTTISRLAHDAVRAAAEHRTLSHHHQGHPS
jgi:2-dehydro-3-deoxyphosphogluconate aldolase/(4S)-4-hydroxy-2-oxoglutarate aldolase